MFDTQNKKIDERDVARLAASYGYPMSMGVAKRIFDTALEELDELDGPADCALASQVRFCRALAVVFDAGRVQGIREERSKR